MLAANYDVTHWIEESFPSLIYYVENFLLKFPVIFHFANIYKKINTKLKGMLFQVFTE
jgi:hypothetical protein